MAVPCPYKSAKGSSNAVSGAFCLISIRDAEGKTLPDGAELFLQHFVCPERPRPCSRSLLR